MKTYQLVIHACVGVCRLQGGGVSSRSRKYGDVGGFWIWVGKEPYVDRAISRMGYITICLNIKYSYM
jgi:hypothetical protein